MINIKSNIKQFVKKEIKAMGDDINKAHVRTVNEVASGGFTATRKEIRARINIKDKDLKEGSRVEKATFKKPIATIHSRARYKGITLAKYGARGKKAVTFMVVRGKRKTLKGGFIATMKSGHTGAFVRNPDEQMKSRPGNFTKHSQKIDDKLGPNQAQLIGSRQSMRTIDGYVRKNYAKKYENNFKYYQGRR
jgi:hypothetical protein